ncbi:hypothetical protein SUDANB176_03225 [Streptomyces sp. enrichment culture]|uniref:D-alanyl-D-alanine carboxypeptidase n=1 Tax=Streptomyces sp. enrichment culture TaxID=1795815 RepID=UPI003F561F98
MAGESPDRSKQRESSAEPTSGSAGPVPEARNSTEKPDPRLGVTRETSSSESRGSVDTATRVLSAREATEGTAEAGDAPSGKRDDSAAQGDGRLRETVAAWVRPAAPGEAGDAPAGAGAGSADGTGTDAEAGAAARDDSDGERTAAAGEPKTEDAAEAGPDADASEPEADGSPRGGTAAEDEDASEGADDDADAGTPEPAAPTADEDGDGPRNGAAPAAADDDPADAPETTPPPGSPEADGDAPAEAGSEAAAKGPVDQPTAVFRTGRPSAPSVDQPTTILKLGGTAPKAEPDGASAGEGAEPESESERTSKFVALKALDDPGTRRPPRGGDVTTALRAVTPAARPSSPAEATTSVPQVGPERTTQQPLPPKPPLDLLAELTNTPPPPETPLRTAVRRVKIWTPLVLLLVIVFAVVQNVRPLPAPTLELTARDSYSFEGGEVDIPWPADGQAALDVQGIGTFGSSGEQKPVPIASVAKVMTAYLILRDHPLKSGAEGPMIEIDELAEKQSDAGPESTVNVTAGDEISQREAIEAILIASANNVARLLARWDAGSEKAFVEKMNEAAKDLGMSNTTYTDPSGLNDTTVSTAVDQVKLARAAMEQPAFREVAAMMSYDDYKGVNHPNWNQLVGSNNVVGIKTGTTTSALGNLVFAAKKEVGGETRTIVGAVVRQPAGGVDNSILSAALTAGDRLIRAAQGALESATILKKGTVVGYVDDGLGGRTPVVVTEDVKAVGWAGLSVKLTFAADELPHRAEAGTKVGTLTVGDGTSGAVKVPVSLQEDLVEPGFTDRLTRLS